LTHGQCLNRSCLKPPLIFLKAWRRCARDDRLAYIDHGGSLTVTVADANIEVVGNFVEGLAVARAGEYYGYIDTTGDWRIQIQFRQAKDFSEGLAAVQKERFYGFINRQGDWVVEPQFELADGFAQGLAAVKQDGLYGYVDITWGDRHSGAVPRCLAVCQRPGRGQGGRQPWLY
jgi:hypothetical protein